MTLSSSLAQSWQTLFLIYFRFVCCLTCPEFVMEMKCETTLRDLEISQILFLRHHKEESRQNVYLLFTSIYFLACVVDFCCISCYNKCYFSKKTFFFEIWKIIFFSFLAWIFQMEWLWWAFKSQLLPLNSSGKRMGLLWAQGWVSNKIL